MSLRSFHIVFIIVTVVLSLYVSMWGIREFAMEKSTLGLVLSVIFLINAGALILYGKKTFGKLRDLP
jgi:hypothetical protein